MVEKSIEILNESGLHARPASDFVKFVKGFDAKISIVKDDKTVNAKSILHVLSLSLKKGTTCLLRVEGENENEEEVLDKITEYIRNIKE